eukprot:TRINITY_DN2416_c0_g1_i1.p1 TRINITY_DN2416_c0_g1~~TRINITY_DN2416_c0_g1_i1.p1  ORF type:complete len:100 (-),score=24.07 TRINITY_DN2416_c0_g1_i1:82-381(-)
MILLFIVLPVSFCYIFCFFFFKQKTAYEMLRSLVGSEMCIRDSMGTKGIVATCATGTLPDNRFEECLQTCRKLCERVLSFGRSMVKRKLDAISVSKCVD